MRKIASHLVLTPQGLERNRLVVFDDNGTVLGYVLLTPQTATTELTDGQKLTLLPLYLDGLISRFLSFGSYLSFLALNGTPPSWKKTDVPFS